MNKATQLNYVFAQFGAFSALALGMFVLAACTSAGPIPISEADLKTLRAEAAELESQIELETKKRRKALREAWATIRPATDGIHCPFELAKVKSTEFRVHSGILPVEMLPDSYDLDKAMPRRIGKLVVPGKKFGSRPKDTPMDRIRAKIALMGPRAHVAGNMLSSMEDRIKERKWYPGTDPKTKLDYYKNRSDRFDYELIIVAEVNERPEHNGKIFLGGHIVGRAYLYLYKEDKVICAADVDAQNADKMKLEINPNDENVRGHQELEDDLDQRAFEQAIQRLVAVGN